MFQSMTKGILHFEDLDPKMFEVMCRDIFEESNLFSEIRSYGIEGTDEGVDILCIEKDKKLRHFIQCKRYQHLSTSDLHKIVDRIIEGNNDTEGQAILVVTSCDVSKKAYEDFEIYAHKKGFSKANIIGRIDLDSKLHKEPYISIKERFFGSEFDKEKNARQKLEDARNGKKMVEQKLLQGVQQYSSRTICQIHEFPYKKFRVTEVIIRSIDEENYPDANKDGETDTWFKSFLHDIDHDGILLNLTPWTYNTIVINPNGEWLTKDEFKKLNYEGEALELNTQLIRKIPFSNLMQIDEDGDDIHTCPIIYCKFSRENGPFTSMHFDYHDLDRHTRIIFKKGKRALINEDDYWRLKRVINNKHSSKL